MQVMEIAMDDTVIFIFLRSAYASEQAEEQIMRFFPIVIENLESKRWKNNVDWFASFDDTRNDTSRSKKTVLIGFRWVYLTIFNVIYWSKIMWYELVFT